MGNIYWDISSKGIPIEFNRANEWLYWLLIDANHSFSALYIQTSWCNTLYIQTLLGGLLEDPIHHHRILSHYLAPLVSLPSQTVSNSNGRLHAPTVTPFLHAHPRSEGYPPIQPWLRLRSICQSLRRGGSATLHTHTYLTPYTLHKPCGSLHPILHKQESNSRSRFCRFGFVCSNERVLHALKCVRKLLLQDLLVGLDVQLAESRRQPEGKTDAKVVLERAVSFPQEGESDVIVLRNIGGKVANLTYWEIRDGSPSEEVLVLDPLLCGDILLLRGGESLELFPATSDNRCGFKFGLSYRCRLYLRLDALIYIHI